MEDNSNTTSDAVAKACRDARAYPNLLALADGRIAHGTLAEYPLLRDEAKRALAERAKLIEALTKCRDEHAAQAVCWRDTGDQEHADYHQKWAGHCAAALAFPAARESRRHLSRRVVAEDSTTEGVLSAAEEIARTLRRLRTEPTRDEPDLPRY